MIHLEVGDIVEIALKQYGDIEAFVVRKIQKREQGEYSSNNSLFIGLRQFDPRTDVAIKSERDGEIIYKVEGIDL